MSASEHPYHGLYYLDRGSHVQDHIAHAYILDADFALQEILLRLDKTSETWFGRNAYPGAYHKPMAKTRMPVSSPRYDCIIILSIRYCIRTPTTGAIIHVPDTLVRDRQHLPVEHVRAYLHVVAEPSSVRLPSPSPSSSAPSVRKIASSQGLAWRFRRIIEPMVREAQRINRTLERYPGTLTSTVASDAVLYSGMGPKYEFTKFIDRLLKLKRALPAAPSGWSAAAESRNAAQDLKEDGEGEDEVEPGNLADVDGEGQEEGNEDEDDEDSCVDASDLERRHMQHDFGQRLFDELVGMGVREFAEGLYPYVKWRPGTEGS